MRAKLVNEAYEPKDLKRVKDFAIKSKGDFEKEVALAKQMANTLTNMDKAIGRAEAAAEVYGGWNPIVQVFYNKAKELGYEGPVPGERLQSGIILGSKLPKEQQFKQGLKLNFNSRPSFDAYVLPLGKINLRTGESGVFNVFQNWDNNNTTIEVWRDNKGRDFAALDKPAIELPKTGIASLLKPRPKEEIDLAKRKYFDYKLMFTSGKQPLHEIGSQLRFYHDQTRSVIGNFQMVDYVLLKHLSELILPYGNNLNGYVYK